MVRRALVAGAVGAPLAFAGAFLASGGGAAVSALLGVVVVVGNFAAHGLSLAWAAGISVVAVQAVALGGFAVRMLVVVGLMFGLRAAPFFSPLAFGLAVVASTVALLVYEARLLAAGVGRDLDLPPDPAAVRAAESLRLREAALREAAR